MRDDLTQRVLQIPADPRSLAESEVLSEALAEGRPSIASFIYEREDSRDVLVIVLGAPRQAPVSLPPAPPSPPASPVLASVFTPERVMIGISFALALVWFFLRQ